MKAIVQAHNRTHREKLDFVVPGFDDFNPSDDPSAVGDGIITNGLNFNYDNTGSVQTARGYVRVNTTNLPSPPDNGWTFETAVLRQLIVATVAGYIYRYDNAGGWVQIGGPYTASQRWDGAQFFGKLILVNGVDGVLVWDGTTITVQTISGYAGIKPQFCANRKNRMYFAEKNSSLIWYTNPLDISTIQSGSFNQINTDDGQNITGLGSTIDNLTIGKTNSVWNLIGEPLTAGTTTYVGNLQIRKSNSDVGPVSYKTIHTIANGVQVFVSVSGIYVHQNYQTHNITPNLAQIFKYDMNPNFRHLMWSVYNPLEKKLLVGYTSNAASSPDKVIMVDFSEGHVRTAIWDDYHASFGMQYKFTNTPVTVIGGADFGILWQGFTGYTHMAGNNGTSTGTNTGTTLNDTTKAWAFNLYANCRLQIVSSTGYGQFAYVVSNTATQLTLDRTLAVVPDNTSVYSIGAYHSFVDTKIFDQGVPALIKKYKFLNIFSDSENNYPLQVGFSYGKIPLSYVTTANLSANTWTFESDNSTNGWVWGSLALRFGSQVSLYDQLNLGGNDRFIQCRFGTFQANQPWRINRYSFTYREKKSRPN